MDEILLNRIPNSWIKQSYVQGFDCGSINKDKSVNMFERTEIAESSYEGVVEPFYKEPNRSDSNRDGLSSKMRGESAPSTTYPKMSKSSDKHIKRYVDHPLDVSKHTCIIHGTGHSSDS